MSSSERHRRSKLSKSLCAACEERKARFRYRRAVRADRDHTLSSSATEARSIAPEHDD